MTKLINFLTIFFITVVPITIALLFIDWIMYGEFYSRFMLVDRFTKVIIILLTIASSFGVGYLLFILYLLVMDYFD